MGYLAQRGTERKAQAISRKNLTEFASCQILLGSETTEPQRLTIKEPAKTPFVLITRAIEERARNRRTALDSLNAARKTRHTVVEIINGSI